MKFKNLHDMVPYVTGGKQKSLSMEPYDGVTLQMPGRHEKDTSPPGGDFVVLMSDEELNWESYPFTHTDIFNDIQRRYDASPSEAQRFVDQYYLVVVKGVNPLSLEPIEDPLDTANSRVLLSALQCLSVAEHRRYQSYEAKFGGRYLPLRFAAGIANGYWTAQMAMERQRRGRIGVEWLEKDHGVPALTKKLFKEAGQ